MSEWAQLREFPKYSVSDQGLVRNDDTERVMRTFQTGGGHHCVGLMNNGRQYTRAVSRLVCEEFVPNERPDFFTTPIYLNGDTSNCDAQNLLWRPRWFSLKHTRQFRIEQRLCNPVREWDTGEEFHDLWVPVIRYGLLYLDIILAAYNRTSVFPTMQRFDWIH